MPASTIDRAHAAPRAGIAAGLSTLGGALLLILSVLASLTFVLDILGRYGANRPLLGPQNLDLATTYFGLGFAAVSLLALPAAFAAPFVRTGDPALRSHSALALVPGCGVALAILIAAFTAVALMGSPGGAAALTMAVSRVTDTFAGFVFLCIPVAIVFAAVLGGGRTPEATAAVAAPVVLAVVAGMFAELSIGGVLLSLLFPLLAAAIVLALLYAAAPARTVTPWLAGIALALGMTFLVSTGFATPTETIGLMALFGIPIALLVRTLALRHPIGVILRQAATETVSVVAIMAAVTAAFTAVLLINRAPIGLGLAATPAVLIGGGAAFLVASYFLTPTLGLGLALPIILPSLQAAKIEPMLAAAILILLSLAAIAARAARREPAAQGLPPGAAFVAAAAFVALAAVTALLPDIVLGPARALLN
jgi:hypothetical protein